MSARGPHASLLRWYPAAWRDRYGDEFAALMEDHLGSRPPTLGFRLSIAWAGLRERGHEAGLVGDSTPAANRAKSGALVVLCAWTAFVLAGTSFAKLAEHFAPATPLRTRSLPTAAYDAVFAVATVSGVLVVTGAMFALPSFLRFLRAGGWPSIRGHVLRAAGATVALVVGTAAVVAVAHTLTPAQRNGDSLYHPVVWYYLLGFLATVLLVAATLALWAVAVAAAVRQLDLPRPVLRTEAVLAIAVSTAMAVMTAGTALWWGAIASSAPWFLQGAQPGLGASAFDPNLVVTMGLMLTATLVGAYGSLRVVMSRDALRPG